MDLYEPYKSSSRHLLSEVFLLLKYIHFFGYTLPTLLIVFREISKEVMLNTDYEQRFPSSNRLNLCYISYSFQCTTFKRNSQSIKSRLKVFKYSTYIFVRLFSASSPFTRHLNVWNKIIKAIFRAFLSKKYKINQLPRHYVIFITIRFLI